ncbi:hypothetical protein [Paraburkholderia sartisoli]|uniref:Lipoprotein-attachment site-containing protein n=1 Tax=Paraburkholderia sartisoli TaxID=83784 RepID=A0A1H4CI33_9BURK|nr:hypothetical protein [Paraburkholderia sartisoli]SEA59998.1 hypothetical protein SAMN05192564_102319 [Paraburkholderia sartisoli]
MKKLTVTVLAVCLVMLAESCSGNPPEPILPDGSHRVPVNRVPPVPLVSPVTSTDGARS